MVHMFLSQENGVAVVAGLSENLDGDLHFKVDLTFTALSYAAQKDKLLHVCRIIKIKQVINVYVCQTIG